MDLIQKLISSSFSLHANVFTYAPKLLTKDNITFRGEKN